MSVSTLALREVQALWAVAMDDPWLAIRMEPRKDYYLLLVLLWISFAFARVDARRARFIPYVLLSLAHSPPPLARSLAAASPALATAYPWMIVFMSSKAAAPPRARCAHPVSLLATTTLL